MTRAIFEADHDLFRDTVRSFVAAEVAPFRDARVQTIYGGTTEIMKEIVAKSLGL